MTDPAATWPVSDVTSDVRALAFFLNSKAWEAVQTAEAEARANGWDVTLATRHLRAGVDKSLEDAASYAAFLTMRGWMSGIEHAAALQATRREGAAEMQERCAQAGLGVADDYAEPSQANQHRRSGALAVISAIRHLR